MFVHVFFCFTCVFTVNPFVGFLPYQAKARAKRGKPVMTVAMDVIITAFREKN